MLRIGTDAPDFPCCYFVESFVSHLKHPERQFPKNPGLVLEAMTPLRAILINPSQSGASV
jgi:hypothetical protein